MADVHAEMIKMIDSHPSLEASLEDFEHHEQRPSAFRYPSHRSGFGAQSEASEPSSNSDGPWSPTLHKQSLSGSGWYRHQPYLDESPAFRSSARSSASRGGSAGLDILPEDDDPTMMPANIPLPRESMSPSKEVSSSPARNLGSATGPTPDIVVDDEQKVPDTPGSPVMNNYIRFSVRADMQHRTEPFEAAFNYVRKLRNYFSASRSNALTSITIALLSLITLRLLTRSPFEAPAPDLVKIAGLARSFEPLIYYSEAGNDHITNLQETGVAVWDLGESVRAANMSGAETIVTQLDDLADSLKSLGMELTKFFAAVDGDIDNILLVMDWAKRELSTLSSYPPSSIGSAMSNIHTIFTRTGLLEDPKTGKPNVAGNILASFLGSTPAQRTRATLQRTFIELLTTLEESINDEIKHTTRLFSLFAIIDKQFQNLQRTTVRELDTTENAESQLLSSLWQRALGANASQLRKYEKNKQLLMSVRQRTVSNKNFIVEHNHKLMALQENLEVLRRRLVKPVIHEQQGSSAGVEAQIEGLQGTYEHLRKVREEQKGRVLERLYGGGAVRGEIGMA